MHRLLLAALAAALALLAGAADARSLAEVSQAGVIRVGVNPNFPPMSSYGRTNQFEGFDVDVASEIARALGVKVQLVPTATAQRIPFLTAGRVDLALGALTITPERAQVVDFTLPLHTETMSVLLTDRVRATSWRELDRPEVTLVNMRGNTSVALLKEKLPRAKLLLVDGNADTVRALAQGRADAMVENIDFFWRYTKAYPNVAWRRLPEPILTKTCGIGVEKGNATLRAAVDDVLRRLHGDGTVGRLWEKWYGMPMTVPVKL
jgi:polar amino acid transport system substrate-binding protein